MENTLSDQTILPTLPKRPANLLPLMVVGGLMLMFGLVIGMLMEKVSVSGGKGGLLVANDQTDVSDQDNSKMSFKSLNDSTFASYTQMVDGKLFLVPINPGIGSFSPNIEINWGRSSYGMGSTDPVAAPDNQKVALIEKETNNLILLSADGKQQVRVSNQLQIDYISGWSPDSTKLLVLAGSPTLKSIFLPEGPVPAEYLPISQIFKPTEMANGYYLIDLAKNKIVHLPYLSGSSFITWVDSNRALFNPGEFDFEKYVVFDFGKLEANAELMAGKLDSYFGEQISIDKAGKFWALTLSPTDLMNSDNDESKIVYAEFPSIEGLVIGEGKFAQVQGPIISPNGDKVIFRAYDEVNGPNYVHYFNGQETVRLFAGIPRKWINNDKFIYAIPSIVGATNPDLTDGLFLYDTVTGESLQLFGN